MLRHEGLRVAVDERKPGALHLHHQAVAFAEGVHEVLHGEGHGRYLVGREGLGLEKLSRKRPRITSERTICW